MNQQRIAIIGGGYTGLVAALRLAQAGHSVELFETGGSLGGLAGGFTIEKASLEKAYHHLFRTDTAIIALAEELGIAEKLEWHTSDTALYYQGVLHPFRGALDLARFKPLHFHNRIRTGLVALYLQFTKKWQPYTTVTAYEWMRKAVGKQASTVIWEPLLRGKFDHFYDRVAMAWLWARIHIRANSKAKGDSREKLGYFRGGFDVLTQALRQAATEHGVTIRLNSPISSLTPLPENRTAVRQGEHTLDYDAVVATIPSTVFARLVGEHLSVTAREQLSSIDYLGARVMIFSSTQDLSDYYWHNINDLDLPFLVFINHTKLISKEHYSGQNIYYLAAYLPADHPNFTADDATIEDLWFTSLAEIFPHFDRGQLREVHQFRFPHAQHIVDTTYAAKIPAHQTELPNVWLSNFSQIFPEDRGTNYAVRDGERIAAEVVKSLEQR